MTRRNDNAALLVSLLIQAEFDLDEQSALLLAQRVADGMFRLAGGEQLYIPKLDRRRRNAAIRREFNGRNVAEICARYGICRSQLYRILNQRSF